MNENDSRTLTQVIEDNIWLRSENDRLQRENIAMWDRVEPPKPKEAKAPEPKGLKFFAESLERRGLLGGEVADKLSHRAKMCLVSEGLRTVDDIRAMGDAGLLRIPNFGKKTLAEVKAAIKGKVGHARIFMISEYLECP